MLPPLLPVLQPHLPPLGPLPLKQLLPLQRLPLLQRQVVVFIFLFLVRLCFFILLLVRLCFILLLIIIIVRVRACSDGAWGADQCLS